MEVPVHEYRTVKLTRLAVALLASLEGDDTVVATDYQLYLRFRKLFENPEGLYLRNAAPSVAKYRQTRNLLLKANKLARDNDYGSAFRILSKQDLPADEVTCALDPFCYISHLSSMQRYGLTDRRPEALHLTLPGLKILKPLLQKKMETDYGTDIQQFDKDVIYPLNVVHHPKTVRKRHLETFSTVNFGQSIEVKGSKARVATIGQTFLDMLEAPHLCGGMAHVLDIWEEHARKFLKEIIPAIDNAPKDIYKVRAGYILDERMLIQNSTIDQWQGFAQRGGSRILDPAKPFINKFSEKWMLSINVE